jgi:predicted RNase H-like HicB family nuclease
MEKRSMVTRIRTFSLARYVDTALSLAQYERDENGVVVAIVPDAAGFFSQGETFEEARSNLRDAVEGNVLLALQLNLPIPVMPGIAIEEQDAEAFAA